MPAENEHDSIRKVILVRHGESELNARNRTGDKYFCGQINSPLTEIGRQQAREVGRQLAANSELRIGSAVSSTLSRAIETLHIIISELQGSPRVLDPQPGFNERSLGVFEGRKGADVYREFPLYREHADFRRFRNDFNQCAPGGENLSDVTQRVWKAWDYVCNQASGSILIVAHSKSIQTWLGKAQGLSQVETLLLKVHNATPIIVDWPPAVYNEKL